MRRFLLRVLLIPFFTAGCLEARHQLPEITAEDIKASEDIVKAMQSEIDLGQISELPSQGDDLNQKGWVAKRALQRLIDMIMPNHLKDFNKHNKNLSRRSESFAEYRGKYGRCYQFRVFYPYQDNREDNVHWASSVLSIPRYGRGNSEAGVVLAPTLDGFTPIIESGLWLKLCNQGLAVLMPESLYQLKNEDSWKKLHFDPTPPYRSIDEYDLYETSIQRYEKLLNRNIEIMRNLSDLKSDRDGNFYDYPVMRVHPKSVGFWGSSFGAVVGSLVVAKDPEIPGAVLTVGGGDLPSIISYSKIDLFKETRREQMKLQGIRDINEYRAFISQYIESDPLNYAKKSDRDRLFMIIARKDTSVPSEDQYKLLNQFGRPSHGIISSNHVGTLLYTAWLHGRSSEVALDRLIKKLKANRDK